MIVDFQHHTSEGISNGTESGYTSSRTRNSSHCNTSIEVLLFVIIGCKKAIIDGKEKATKPVGR